MGKYDYPCKVCKKNFADCPHSHDAVREWEEEQTFNKKQDKRVKRLVREVLIEEGLIPDERGMIRRA